MSANRKTHEMTANDARVRFRDALDHVRSGADVLITRYGKTEAVLVHPDWYNQARALMDNRSS